MTETTAIPNEAQTARTLPEMLAAVPLLRQADSVKAIGYLAQMHRSAPGWLTVSLSGLLRISFTLMLVGALLLLVSQITGLFWRFSRNLAFLIYPDQLSTWAVLLLSLTLLVLYRADGVRALWRYRPEDGLTAVDDIPKRLELLVRGLLRLLEGVVQAAMVILVAAFLMLTLNPLILLLLNISNLLTRWWLERGEILATIRLFWVPSLGSLLLLILLIYLLRRSSREKLVGANLTVWSLSSLVDWGAAVQQAGADWFATELLTAVTTIWRQLVTPLPFLYDWGAIYYEGLQSVILAMPWEAALMITAALALFYPIGLAVWLAERFYAPYRLLHGAFLWLIRRWQLRWRIGAALRHHRRRNQAQIGSDGWAAICQKHWRRCETQWIRVGYRQLFSYSCCPHCHTDNFVYTGVYCIALYFDERMSETAVQKGKTLLINGLAWLKEQQAPPIIDALVVGQVNPHDVELALALYQEKVTTPPHKPLAQISGRLLAGVEVSENVRRIVAENTHKLVANYDPEGGTDACTQNARLHDAVQKRSRQVRLATRKALRTAVFLLLLLLLVFYGPARWQQAAGWWESFASETIMPLIITPTPTMTPRATPAATPTRTPVPMSQQVAPNQVNLNAELAWLRPALLPSMEAAVCDSDLNTFCTISSPTWEQRGMFL